MDHDLIDKLQQELLNEYPQLPWLEVDLGWIPIISDMMKELSPYFQKDPTFKIEQVKQKFAGLRVYFSSREQNYEEINAIVNKSVKRASLTCEMCGATEGVAVVSPRYWMFNLCPNCFERVKRELKR